jgi:hypothetical protein
MSFVPPAAGLESEKDVMRRETSRRSCSRQLPMPPLPADDDEVYRLRKPDSTLTSSERVSPSRAVFSELMRLAVHSAHDTVPRNATSTSRLPRRRVVSSVDTATYPTQLLLLLETDADDGPLVTSGVAYMYRVTSYPRPASAPPPAACWSTRSLPCLQHM